MQMQMDIVVGVVSHFYINILLYTAYKGMHGKECYQN